MEGRGKDVGATQLRVAGAGGGRNSDCGPEVRKAELILFLQTLGGPRERQPGEECLCNTAG